MLERAKDIIDTIAKETDTIILMHSLTGKDSIAMLDLCYPKFKRIVCVYMYVVPNLRYVRTYYNYAIKKYPNIEFYQVPHYAEFSYRKRGALGREGNPKQREWRLTDIIDKLCTQFGIEWACLGFKQSDSLNRRLMLRSYKDGKEAINWKTKRFYPFSTYKNGDILNYIKENQLKRPNAFEKGQQNSYDDITNRNFLLFLKNNYPDDLQKIYEQYPATRALIEAGQ